MTKRLLFLLSWLYFLAVKAELPPLQLFVDFAKPNALHGIVICQNLLKTKAEKSELVDLIKSSGDVPISVVSTRGNNIPSNWDELNVIPLAAGDWARLFLEEAFTNKPRDDSAFWMVEFPQGSTEDEIRQFFSTIPLDIDDNVVTFQKSGSPHSYKLYDAYKINRRYRDTKLLELSVWHQQEGFVPLSGTMQKWQRRRNLEGHHFRITTLHSPPFITEFGVDSMDGMFAEDIMNFTFSVVTPEDKAYGAYEEKTGQWSGMVGQLARREVDIGVVDFTVTKERSQFISFGHTITQIFNRFFIKNPTGNFHYTAYLQPLHYTSWVAVAVIVATSPWALFLANRFSGGIEENPQEFSLSKSYVFAASILTFARPWNVSPSANITRIVFLSLLLCGIFVFWHWEAMLISYLATRIIVLPFENLRELMDTSNFKIMLLTDSALSDSFKFSKDPLWQKVNNERIEPDIASFSGSSTPELLGLLLHHPDFEDFALYDNYQALRSFQESINVYVNCSLIAPPTNYDYKPYAFGFQKDFPYLGLFNYYLKEMSEKGSLKQILDKYEPLDQVCPDYSGKALGFDNCFTAFLALLGGLLLAIAIYSLEVLAAQLSKSTVYGWKSMGSNLKYALCSYNSNAEVHSDFLGPAKMMSVIRSQRLAIQVRDRELDSLKNAVERIRRDLAGRENEATFS